MLLIDYLGECKFNHLDVLPDQVLDSYVEIDNHSQKCRNSELFRRGCVQIWPSLVKMVIMMRFCAATIINPN